MPRVSDVGCESPFAADGFGSSPLTSNGCGILAAGAAKDDKGLGSEESGKARCRQSGKLAKCRDSQRFEALFGVGPQHWESAEGERGEEGRLATGWDLADTVGLCAVGSNFRDELAA